MNTEIIQESPTNTDRLQKHDIFETYVLWKTLPMIFKRQGRMFVQDKLQIEDEAILELCEISSQTDFAERYGVNPETLTRWNKLIKERDEFVNIRNWMQPMLKNVILSAYNVALKGDPKANADRRMLLEFAGWKPEIGVNHKVEGLNDLLREEARQLVLQEQKTDDNTGTTITIEPSETLQKQS